MTLDMKQQDATALAKAIADGVLTAREAMDAAIEAAQNGALWAPLHISIQNLGATMRPRSIPALTKQLLPECHRCSRTWAGHALDCRSVSAHAPVLMRHQSLIQNWLHDYARPVSTSSEQQLCRNSAWHLPVSLLTALSLATHLMRRGLLQARPVVQPPTVAAGIVSIAHATDAGGSIRVPAAACGLIGLKPSRGAMPAGPHFGNYLAGIASEFALCRSIRDAKTLYPLMVGNIESFLPDVALASDTRPEKLRIGITSGDLTGYPITTERQQVVADAARFLEAQGHTIREIKTATLAPLIDASATAFDRIISANLASAIDAFSIDKENSNG